MQELSEEIVLLRLLTAEPAIPTRNVFVDDQGQSSSVNAAGRTLSFANERDIVDSFAFLSATSDDPEKVIAVCLEEGCQSDSCTIRIAMNSHKLGGLVADLGNIAQVLERADHKNYDDNLHELLSVVVPMNRNRILARLRSKHMKSSKKADRCAILSRLGEMVGTVCSMKLPDQTNAAAVIDLKSTTNRLVEIFARLEALPTKSLTTGRADGILLRLLRSLDDLPSTTDVREILSRLTPLGRFQGQEAVVMTITKLRKYRAACDYLVKAAKRFSVFRRVEVSEVTFHPSKVCPSVHAHAEDRFLGCLERVGIDWSNDTELRVGSSLSKACAQFCNEMKSLKPKVHAEIQLLFHYEINPNSKCPRVICSSKSACFLCERFLRLHGQFFVERTHGVLYPKWTLPDIDQISRLERRRAIYELVNTFRHNLQAEIQENLVKIGPRRTHPNESVISLTNLQPWLQSDESFGRGSAASGKQCARGPLAGEVDVEKLERAEEECENRTVAGQPTSRGGNKSSTMLRLAIPPPQTVNETASEELRRERPTDSDSASLTMQKEVSTSSASYRTTHHSSLDNEGLGGQSELRSPSRVRSSVDLDCSQRQQTAAIIRDHGSRISTTPAECDTTKIGERDHHSVSHSVGVSRKFDFHELELFLESSRLSTANEVTRLSSKPQKPYIGSVVNVDSLIPGEELVLDLDGSLDKERVIFLTMQNQSEVQNWWKVRWYEREDEQEEAPNI